MEPPSLRSGMASPFICYGPQRSHRELVGRFRRQAVPRAFVFILGSVGIGASADASQYGDTGADTVGHVAECCARRQADRTGVRSGTLAIPNLVRVGLGEACRLATRPVPPGL